MGLPPYAAHVLSSRRARRPAPVAVACLLVAAGLAFPGPAARAQSGPQPGSGIRLKLVRQPVWAEPGDRLGLRLRVFNDSGETLDGFRLSIAVYGAVATRSDLHATFDQVPPGLVASSYPREFLNLRIPSGGAHDVVVDDRIEDSLVSLRGETEPGVYPLTVSLVSADGGTTLDFVTTDLLYYPTRPEIPLDFVLVLPINAIPSESPDGVFRPNDAGGIPLEDALDGGWLEATVDALDDWAGGKGVRLGVAPTPRLMEELSHLADGYFREDAGERTEVEASSPRAKAAASALERLGEVLGRKGVQPLLTPYAFPDLPSLTRAPDQLLAQVDVGRTALKETLGLQLTPGWLFPPAGRLDPAALQLLGQNARRTFFSEGSLEEPLDPAQAGCPDPRLTFACPISVHLPAGGSTLGFAADQGVQDRFADLAQGGSRLDLQELFAETAMIHAELPGQSGRVVHATVPSLWHPPGRLLSVMLQGFARAPWLRTLTPGRALHQPVERAPRRLRQVLPPLQNDPGDSLLDEVDAAGDTVASFGSINPPEALVRRLSRDVLASQSRTWWTDPALAAAGQGYAAAARETALGELAKITIGGVTRVTMTSRHASIPLAVFNDADYPVRIRVRFSSTNFTFDPSEIEATFEPGVGRLPESVTATAKSSGIFPISVSAETPDGLVTFDQTEIRVRSTEFNRIALTLTIGALAFLIFFYMMKAVRRRRATRSESVAEAAPSGGA